MRRSKKFNSRRAVLISGGVYERLNYPRYLNDLTVFHTCLVNRYNFSPSDIQVLYADGSVSQIGGNPVQEATKNNVLIALKKAIQGIIPVLGTSALQRDDLLVIFTTNHGDRNRLLLRTPQEYLESTELGRALSATGNDYYCLAIFGQCYGADLFNQVLQNTAPNKRVLVAASNGVSYAMLDETYDEFLSHFTAALAGTTPSGYPANADTNRDGHLVIKEAFGFTSQMDRTKDRPQIDDGGSGLASKMTLEGLLR